jgi:chemotaxis protein MotA
VQTIANILIEDSFMDRGTLLGFLLGIGLLAYVIYEGGNAKAFLHAKSLIVVIGGIIASTFIRFPFSNVLSSFVVASKTFFTRPQKQQDLVRLLVVLSNRAKREGILALEKHMPDDSFLAMGLRMAIDRLEQDMVKNCLNAEIQATLDRHDLGQETFRFIAVVAPSFGMVGTLIGMVQLFASIEDPSNLAAAMALSLLSTLWGAIIAYLFAMPIAGKLELRSREEAQNKVLMMEGVIGIQSEMHPSHLEEHLNAFLAPGQKVRRSASAV